MGRVVVNRPPLILAISWHSTPYGDRPDCWGCGLPADRRIDQAPGNRPLLPIVQSELGWGWINACQWCAELIDLLIREHDRRYA